MNNKQVIFKNISWLLLDKVIRIIIGLAVGIWVARYLGPSDFGILNYSIAFVTFFSFLSKLGLDQIVVRELASNEEIKNKINGSVFTLKLIGSLFAVLFAILSIVIIKDNQNTQIIVGLIALGYLFQSFDTIDYFFQAKILSKAVVIARGLGFLISSIIKILFILYEFDVRYFGLAILIDIILNSVFLIAGYNLYGYKIKQWVLDISLAKKILGYSGPLMLSTFIITIYTSIDQIMIDSYLNSSQVGIYSVAVKLSKYWLFIPTILISTLMPYFVKIRVSNPKNYKNKLVQLYSLMFWMSTCVGVLVSLWGQELILLLYGAEYIDSYKALVLNIWSGIFISQAMARGIWLISENLQKYRLYNNLIAVILNIVGNMLLIPRFGIAGAAIATLITQAMGTWIFGLIWKPLRASTIDLFRSINPIHLYSLIADGSWKYKNI